MIVTQYKMTGQELKRIYEVSELKGPEFAARLGIGKTKLHAQFSAGVVDEEIERKLISDPELASKRMLFKVEDKISENQPNSPPEKQGPSMEIFEKSMEMVTETLMMVKDSLKIIADDNRFIKDDAELFKAIVKKGMEQGAIQFHAPAKKIRG